MYGHFKTSNYLVFVPNEHFRKVQTSLGPCMVGPQLLSTDPLCLASNSLTYVRAASYSFIQLPSLQHLVSSPGSARLFSRVIKESDEHLLQSYYSYRQGLCAGLLFEIVGSDTVRSERVRSCSCSVVKVRNISLFQVQIQSVSKSILSFWIFDTS